MTEYRDKMLHDERIVIDGKRFSGCTFRNCEIVFKAEAACDFAACGFYDCRWTLEGPAQRTVQFLQVLYHGLGDAGRQLVEQTFENIRRPPA